MTIELEKGPEQGSQTPPEGGESTPPSKEEPKTPYTLEEVNAFTPTSDIDMDRVPESHRSVIENMTRDYRELQKDHTVKSQKLAELERTPEPEVYFKDSNEDTAFKEYLKDPDKFLVDLGGRIASYEGVVPDDGVEEYRNAKRWITYLNGVEKRFLSKRIEVSEKQRQTEMAEVRFKEELGAEAVAVIEYAKLLGFTEREFKTRPELRASVKKMYDVANAGRTANLKLVKKGPQPTAKVSGEAGAGGTGHDFKDETENPNLSTEDRIAIWRERKRKGR